jgi:hypothetical protein
MPPQVLFAITVVLGLAAWGIVVVLYVWPALRRLQRADALRPLLVLHTFRFIGLAFIVPGVVSPDLPAAYARPDAYGDLIAAVLALLALAGLRAKFGWLLVWAFNLWGSADLVNAFYEGGRVGLTDRLGQLGSTYFLVAVVVPLLVITHGLIFRLLLQNDGVSHVSKHQRVPIDVRG